MEARTFFLFALHGAEVVLPVENRDPAETAQGDAVAGLAETETGLMNGIHQVRFVDDHDFTPRGLASHDRGRHLELTQIHSFLPGCTESDPSDVGGL